jgi:hypothetical protein
MKTSRFFGLGRIMNHPSFGVNLGVIAPWSSNPPFLDSHGWLRSLPIVQGKTQSMMAAVLWNSQSSPQPIP